MVPTFTPGPWHVKKHRVYEFVQDAQGFPMTTSIHPLGVGAPFADTRAANAALIAAAPDLYAALRVAEAYLTEQLGPCAPDCTCLLHGLRAALAKAEGREP